MSHIDEQSTHALTMSSNPDPQHSYPSTEATCTLPIHSTATTRATASVNAFQLSRAEIRERLAERITESEMIVESIWTLFDDLRKNHTAIVSCVREFVNERPAQPAHPHERTESLTHARMPAKSNNDSSSTSESSSSTSDSGSTYDPSTSVSSSSAHSHQHVHVHSASAHSPDLLQQQPSMRQTRSADSDESSSLPSFTNRSTRLMNIESFQYKNGMSCSHSFVESMTCMCLSCRLCYVVLF